MLHNPLDLTPFRPELINLLSVPAWAGCETAIAAVVIFLSFMQKKYDGNTHVTDVLGFISYVSLVLKAAFAFSIMWDGVYVSLHSATEPPRAIATAAVTILALQQTRDLLGKITALKLIQSRSAALLSCEIPPQGYCDDHDPPQWVMFLVDTEGWLRALMPKQFRGKGP